MESLWAPWRAEYIKKASIKEEGCFLCDAWNSSEPKTSWVVHKEVLSFVILNIYPYNSGHVMVVPSKHVANLEDLEQSEAVNLISLLQKTVLAIKSAYNPLGLNIGMNLGRAAGAGLEDHLHFHIVPRWYGDTNFMPIVSQTKVLPETLDETFLKLKKAFEELER